jgi:hypothetical protein
VALVLILGLILAPAVFFLLTLASDGASASGFRKPVIYTAGNSPNCVTAGDFNFDGFIDVAATNALSNDVSIFLGNGDGTLQAAVNYPVGKSPGCLAYVQDRGPGMPLDLVVSNIADNTVSVLLNNGDGTFQPAVNYGVGTGTAPIGIAGIDTTFDGFVDFVVANSTGGTNNAGNVAVLVANGDGTFQPAVNYDTQGTGPLAILESDFQLPKLSADLAVANSVSNDVTVLLNDGTGKFAVSSVTPVGTAPSGLSGEGLYTTNLIVSNFGSDNLTYLFGNNAGGFQHTKNYAAGRNPSAVVDSSLNPGSLSDLAVTNEGDNAVGVYLGRLHPPYFRKPKNFPTCSSPKSITVADLNLDHRLDLIVACAEGVGVMLYTGP